MEMKESNKQFDDVKASLHTEALALADYLDNNVEAMLFTEQPHLDRASAMIRRLVEELDKQNPSMFTILSCGCKSSFMGFPSEWDGETRECEPCVNYGSLCEQHFMEYEARPAQYTPQTKKSKPVVYWDGKNFASKEKSSLADIPLYTTPHHDSDVKQTKPLSDGEIEEVIRKHWNREYGNRNMLTLCKAVLDEADK